MYLQPSFSIREVFTSLSLESDNIRCQFSRLGAVFQSLRHLWKPSFPPASVELTLSRANFLLHANFNRFCFFSGTHIEHIDAILLCYCKCMHIDNSCLQIPQWKFGVFCWTNCWLFPYSGIFKLHFFAIFLTLSTTEYIYLPHMLKDIL